MSVVRSSVVIFSHFRLLPRNHSIDFDETWQEANIQCPLPILCSFRLIEKKTAALASDWLRYFQILPCNRWTDLTKLVRQQVINVLYQVCVFRNFKWEMFRALSLLGMKGARIFRICLDSGLILLIWICMLQGFRFGNQVHLDPLIIIIVFQIDSNCCQTMIKFHMSRQCTADTKEMSRKLTSLTILCQMANFKILYFRSNCLFPNAWMIDQ